MPKIDISNVYIWHDKDIYYIVKSDVTNCVGRNFGGVGKMVPMYVLQQLYYRLNRINVNAKILKK